MSSTGEFRRSMFGGFNENDVIDYIKKINREHKHEVEELQNRIEELQKEIDEKNDEINGKNSEINVFALKQDELEKAKATCEVLNEQANEKIDELRQTIDAKDKVIEEKDAIVMGVNAKINKLVRENEKLASRLKYYDESKQKYETFNARFGSIVTQAHTQAERVINDAMNEYEDIASESVKALEYFSEHFVKLRDDIGSFSTAVTEMSKLESMLSSSAGKIDSDLKKLSEGMAEALDVLENQKKKTGETELTIKNETKTFRIDLSVLDELIKDDVPQYDEEEFQIENGDIT